MFIFPFIMVFSLADWLGNLYIASLCKQSHILVVLFFISKTFSLHISIYVCRKYDFPELHFHDVSSWSWLGMMSGEGAGGRARRLEGNSKRSDIILKIRLQYFINRLWWSMKVIVLNASWMQCSQSPYSENAVKKTIYASDFQKKQNTKHT